MTVIVTNAQSRISYNIVKSLSLKGVKVITSDFAAPSMSFASKYSSGHFLYPSPFDADTEPFIECMIENIRKYNASVLIPVCEETFLIAKYKDRLSKVVRVAVPDYDKILLAHNKDRWEHVARELNIGVPETYNINAIRRSPSLADELPFPLLVKPKQGGGGWGITQINSPCELKKHLGEESYCDRPWERFYLQKKIDGETHCVAMLFSNGEIRGTVAYKQLRQYPLKNGQATLRISRNSPEAEKNLQTLFEKIKWHGIVQADFVIDKNSGTPYLIDINPRFWGSLAQGIAAGVDFPYLYYKIALDGDVAPVHGFQEEVMTRWIGGDLCTFFPLLRVAANKIGFAKEFLFPGSAKVYKDDFSFGDPLPLLWWYCGAVARVLKNKLTKPASHGSLQGIWE